MEDGGEFLSIRDTLQDALDNFKKYNKDNLVLIFPDGKKMDLFSCAVLEGCKSEQLCDLVSKLPVVLELVEKKDVLDSLIVSVNEVRTRGDGKRRKDLIMGLIEAKPELLKDTDPSIFLQVSEKYLKLKQRERIGNTFCLDFLLKGIKLCPDALKQAVYHISPYSRFSSKTVLDVLSESFDKVKGGKELEVLTELQLARNAFVKEHMHQKGQKMLEKIHKELRGCQESIEQARPLFHEKENKERDMFNQMSDKLNSVIAGAEKLKDIYCSEQKGVKRNRESSPGILDTTEERCVHPRRRLFKVRRKDL